MFRLFCLLCPAIFFSGFTSLYGQAFTKITDSNNPINTYFPPNQNFSGAAWVDFDKDGDLDLSVTPRFFFRNDGGGNFTNLSSLIGSNQTNQQGNGISWADVDNDGDIDCYLAGHPSSLLLNNGMGSFDIVNTGDIGTNNAYRAWACGFGDWDRDGLVDLLAVHPAGFLGPNRPCRFFHNQGNASFNRIDTFEFTTALAPYTVPYWSDYDQDGDDDLFIASGPGGSSGPDYLYKNLLTETGKPGLRRITDSPIATDRQDGQNWNWIDVDNDGDLDGFVTNWGGAPNRFYRNKNDTLISRNVGLYATENSLSNAWGDFDNDGDQDVIVTNQQGPTHYYQNNGGTFSELSISLTQNVFTSGASVGDYDNDGDLDIFFSGNLTGKGLWRNDNPFPRHWVNLNLEGTLSNRSAIGTRVLAKAHVNGKNVWQRRDVSAQNTFCGHNSLRVHFGLGDATVIDSLVLIWPSGLQEVYQQVAVDSFYTLVEGMATAITPAPELLSEMKLYPNPFRDEISLEFELKESAHMKFRVIDMMGQEVAFLEKGTYAQGVHSVKWDGKNAAGLPLPRAWYGILVEKDGQRQVLKVTKAW